MNFKKLTRPIRFRLIKLLSPSIWWLSQDRIEWSIIPHPSTLFAVDYFKNRKVVCCEIGVFKGESSHSILELLNVKKMYLIDPYTSYVKANDEFVPQDQQDRRRKIAEEKLKKYRSICSWLFMKSVDAALRIPDNSLDFVYIDGDHKYLAVKQELELYFKKIKKNGIMTGHDFCEKYLSIIKAVVDFATKNDLELKVEHTDWILKKP